jgi:septum formation protein
MNTLLLASASPRRQQFVAMLGIDAVCVAPDIDETPLDAEAPEAFVRRLALQKGLACLPDASQRGIATILAADTTVWLDSQTLLNKPDSPQHAVNMLSSLSGRRHFVSTGFAVLDASARILAHEVVTASVWFRALRPSEVEHYVATGEPLDRAGAYAIQGGAASFVQRVEGSWTAIVGLPLAEVVQALASTRRFEHLSWGRS